MPARSWCSRLKAKFRATSTASRIPHRDLRLGLVDASEGKIGSPVDAILLFCYHYDPHTGKYGLLISA